MESPALSNFSRPPSYPSHTSPVETFSELIRIPTSDSDSGRILFYFLKIFSKF